MQREWHEHDGCSEQRKPIPTRLWWVYFAVMAFNIAWLPIAAPREAGTWVDLAVGLLALLGLAGYILRKPFGPRLFWRGFFFLLLIDCVYHATDGVIGRGTNLVFVGLPFGAVLLAPLFVALWRYGRDRDTWTPRRA